MLTCLPNRPKSLQPLCLILKLGLPRLLMQAVLMNFKMAETLGLLKMVPTFQFPPHLQQDVAQQQHQCLPQPPEE